VNLGPGCAKLFRWWWSRKAGSGPTSLYWRDQQWCAVRGRINLHMQIHRIFRNWRLMWIIFFQFYSGEFYFLITAKRRSTTDLDHHIYRG